MFAILSCLCGVAGLMSWVCIDGHVCGCELISAVALCMVLLELIAFLLCSCRFGLLQEAVFLEWTSHRLDPLHSLH